MSTVTKVHGMDGTLVEPDWPPLTQDEVRALLAQFSGCGEPIEIVSVSPRPFSAASVVATRSGRVFVKRHHRTVRDADGLLEEHRFMAHLRAHGAAVPRIFAADSGKTAIESGEWTYEVHEAPDGVDLYEDALSWTPFFCAAHAYSAGQTLARLHDAAHGFSEPPRKARPLVASFSIFAGDDPCETMKHYLAARPALAEDAETRQCCDRALELLAPFHAELLPLRSALMPLWTHNDLHGSNLLWSHTNSSAQAVATIDFGLADRTNAIHDLAHAIERSVVEWLALTEDPAHSENVSVHFDHVRALLEGYEQVRPLSADETAALVPMTALCHAEFALTEADYFLGVLHSQEKARVAIDGYLVGHAQWYSSPGGRKLLDALRRWAEERARRPREAAPGNAEP